MAPTGKPAWSKNKVRKESKNMEKYMTRGEKNDSEDYKKNKKRDRGKHMQADGNDERNCDGTNWTSEKRKIDKRRRKKGE